MRVVTYVGICCFLILTAIFDILGENRKRNTDEIEVLRECDERSELKLTLQDHYLLEDTSIKAKLPTYAECLMQDTVKYKMAVHIEEDEKKFEKLDI